MQQQPEHTQEQPALEALLGTPRKKRRWTDVLLVLVFVVGLGVFSYPAVSQFWNARVSSYAVAQFTNEINHLSEQERDAQWESAVAYNRQHSAARAGAHYMGDDEMVAYEAQLDPAGTGMMGHIEIHKIGVDVPIYHGVEEGVLQVASGHIPWSSLPVGGESTHCVLSGHRGLPTSRLFTDLDQMEIGDVFLLHVLDRTLAYEVDQITVVLPSEVDNLHIEEGQDLCTLVTCTPYAINTHRLLVRGHRVDYTNDGTIQADAVALDRGLVASVVAVPLFTLLLVAVFVRTRRRRYEYVVNDVAIQSRRAARAAEELLGIPPGTAEAAAKADRAARKAEKRARRKGSG